MSKEKQIVPGSEGFELSAVNFYKKHQIQGGLDLV